MNANKLKRLAVAICAAVALLPSQKAHAASVAIDSVQQRWPWNNKVDITYTVTGDDLAVTLYREAVSAFGGIPVNPKLPMSFGVDSAAFARAARGLRTRDASRTRRSTPS